MWECDKSNYSSNNGSVKKITFKRLLRSFTKKDEVKRENAVPS